MTPGDFSAFPLMPPCSANGEQASGYPYPENGLTKRELFAAMAMQGLTPALLDEVGVPMLVEFGKRKGIENADDMIAWLAFDVADAMLRKSAEHTNGQPVHCPVCNSKFEAGELSGEPPAQISGFKAEPLHGQDSKTTPGLTRYFSVSRLDGGVGSISGYVTNADYAAICKAFGVAL